MTFGSPGTYVFKATVVDVHGNVGVDTVTLVVQADVEPPEISLTYDAPDILYGGERILFVVDAEDRSGVQTLEMTVDGQQIKIGDDGVAAYTFNRVGIHEIIVTAIDRAGNIATETRRLEVMDVADTKAPGVSVAYYARDLRPGASVLFNLYAVDNAGVVEKYLIVDGKRVELDSFTDSAYWTFDKAGVYIVEGVARDAAGNISTFKTSITIQEEDAVPAGAPTIRFGENDLRVERNRIRVSALIEHNVNVSWEIYAAPEKTDALQTLPDYTGQGPVVEAAFINDYLAHNGGPIRVTLIVRDGFGNESRSSRLVEYAYNRDEHEYKTRFYLDADGGWTENSWLPEGYGFIVAGGPYKPYIAGEADITYTLLLDGKAIGNDLFSAAVHFDEPGVHKFSWIGRDRFGNIVDTGMAIGVVLDRLPRSPTSSLTASATRVKAGEHVDFLVESSDETGVHRTDLHVRSGSGPQSTYEHLYIDPDGGASHVFTEPGVYRVSLSVGNVYNRYADRKEIVITVE